MDRVTDRVTGRVTDRVRLTDLPPELIHMIALSGYLRHKEVTALSLTCKAMAGVLVHDAYGRDIHSAMRGVVENVKKKRWVSARYALARRWFGPEQQEEDSMPSASPPSSPSSSSSSLSWLSLTLPLIPFRKEKLWQDVLRVVWSWGGKLLSHVLESREEVEEWENVMLGALSLADPDPIDLNNVLCAAVSVGATKLLSWAIELGEDVVGKKINMEESLLFRAATMGHLEVVKLLVQAGAHLEEGKVIDHYISESPMYAACEHGHKDVASFLLKAGALPDALREDFSSALLVATEGCHVEIVKMLVDAGVDLESVREDEEGLYPLKAAARLGHAELVRILVEATENYVSSAVDPIWEPDPLPVPDAVWFGHAGVVRYFLEHGAGVNACDDAGVTGLMIACSQGDEDVVEVFIEAGADLNRTRDGGVSALVDACSGGHAGVVRLLLEAGADLNRTVDRGLTPLHLACAGGHVDVARALIERGADLERDTYCENNTPLYVAVENGQVDVVRFLLESGANPECVGRMLWLYDGNDPEVTRQLRDLFDLHMAKGGE